MNIIEVIREEMFPSRRAGLLFFHNKKSLIVPAAIMAVFPSRRAGLLFFHQGDSSEEIDEVGFHPGERDCCFSTRTMDYENEVVVYAFPSRRAGLLFFHPNELLQELIDSDAGFHPGERDCCFSTGGCTSFPEPEWGFHPGERDCCFSTSNQQKSTRTSPSVYMKPSCFHPGERDCCFSTKGD